MITLSEAWEHPDPKPFWYELADLFNIDPRLSKYVEVVGKCWIWTGYKYKGRGGGTLWYPHGWWKAFRKTGLMHRYTYMLAWGSIPEDKEIHHTCENTLCINPNHCWALTRSEHLALHQDIKSKGDILYEWGLLFHGKAVALTGSGCTGEGQDENWRENGTSNPLRRA